jgi:hypothetical protein
MSRLSQSFAFFNLDPDKVTNDWGKANMTDVTVNEKLKELRRNHRKEQKKVAKDEAVEEFSEQQNDLNQKKTDLLLVTQGKMTKEEYRAKWVK